MTLKDTFLLIYFTVNSILGEEKCYTGVDGGGLEKSQESVTYYLNDLFCSHVKFEINFDCI
jgi:hypothetical protein